MGKGEKDMGVNKNEAEFLGEVTHGLHDKEEPESSDEELWKLYNEIVGKDQKETEPLSEPEPKCPWLRPKHRRRTLETNVTSYKSPEEIFKLLFTREWEYKGGWFNRKGDEFGREKYHKRDRALGALLYLSSGRINEVLRIKKDQFRELRELQHKYPGLRDKNIFILEDFWVSKRMTEHERIKPKWNEQTKMFDAVKVKIPAKKHPILDLPLPRVGTFAPFTALVEEYLEILKPHEKLFEFKESRAWVIINHITGGYDEKGELVGLWNHWFRGASLSYWVNKLGSATRVAKQRGIENPKTIEHYYRGDWTVDKEKMKE